METPEKKAQEEGLTQKEFNDRMNDPNLYQLEDPRSNRSRKYDKKDLKQKKNPRKRSPGAKEDKVTPLFNAVFNSDIEVVRSSIEGGEAVDSLDRDGRSSLFQAIVQGEEAILELLIESGADVTVKDDSGLTPLHFAAQKYQLRMAARIITAGADVDAADCFRQYAAL